MRKIIFLNLFLLFFACFFIFSARFSFATCTAGTGSTNASCGGHAYYICASTTVCSEHTYRCDNGSCVEAAHGQVADNLCPGGTCCTGPTTYQCTGDQHCEEYTWANRSGVCSSAPHQQVADATCGCSGVAYYQCGGGPGTCEQYTYRCGTGSCVAGPHQGVADSFCPGGTCGAAATPTPTPGGGLVCTCYGCSGSSCNQYSVSGSCASNGLTTSSNCNGACGGCTPTPGVCSGLSCGSAWNGCYFESCGVCSGSQTCNGNVCVGGGPHVVQGYVFIDKNNNGVYDRGEGYNGAKINYTIAAGGGSTASTFDFGGAGGLYDGAYQIAMTQGSSYVTQVSLDLSSVTGYTTSSPNPVAITDSSRDWTVNFKLDSGGPPSGSGNIFVTSTQYYPDKIGGLTGADNICQTRATAASLTGTWKAWLSDNTTSAASRLGPSGTYPTNGPYIRMDGVTVANNWADLTDGTLLAPINKTELKTSPPNSTFYVWPPANNAFPAVVTGTDVNGSTYMVGCNNWSSVAGNLNGGNANQADAGWSAGLSGNCNELFGTYSLYCLKATTPPAANGNIFVTSTTYNGNLGGLSGADAKCQAQATAASLTGTWKAWLSDDTTAAKDRLVQSTSPYIRMDGVTVANNWTDLTDGTLLAPINVTEFGTPTTNVSSFGYPAVYTNTQSNGSIYPVSGQSCTNWTNSTGASAGGSANATSTQWTSMFNSGGCDGSLNTGLYCLKQVVPTTYSISGNVFVDSDKNRLQCVGGLNPDGTSCTSESNYPGITISAVDNTGAPVGTISYPSAGSYQIDNLPAGQVTVSYTNPPTSSGYVMTYVPGSPPSFTVTVGGSCSVNSHNNAACSSGSITKLNFGISNTVPWIQSVGGDFYQNGFKDPIPAGASTATPPYGGGGVFASVYGTGQTPGIIYSGSLRADFGSVGSASQTGWAAGGAPYPEVYVTNGLPLSTSYARMDALIDQYAKRTDPSVVKDLKTVCPDLSNCNLSTASDGIYLAYGDVTLTGTSQIASNTNLIILVGQRMKGGSPLGINVPSDASTTFTPQDLNVNGKVLVPNGSTLLFTVSGNINIDKSVGEISPQNYCKVPWDPTGYSGCDIEGYYSADQDFNLNGTKDCSVAPDLRFNLGGSVVSNAKGGSYGFSFNRDLCGSDTTYPVFSITERPDFILNSPDFFKVQKRIWQEVAP